MMQSPLQLMLILDVVGLSFGWLLGAVILRASCSLYNKLAGGPQTYPSDWEDGHGSLGASPQDRLVPEPEFGHAFGIVCVSMLINLMVSFVIGFLVAMSVAGGGAKPAQILLTVRLISLPVGLLTMAGTLTMMLPTSFGRGMVLAFCYLWIVVCIVVLVALVIAGLMAMT